MELSIKSVLTLRAVYHFGVDSIYCAWVIFAFFLRGKNSVLFCLLGLSWLWDVYVITGVMELLWCELKES